MSEQQPLLASPHADVEPGSDACGATHGKARLARWREATAEALESRPWHYAVIILARTPPLARSLPPDNSARRPLL